MVAFAVFFDWPSSARVSSAERTASFNDPSPLAIAEMTADETRKRAYPTRQDPSIGPMRTLPVPANPKLPSLFLIGDSTVRNGAGDGANGQWGWGDFMAGYFDTSKINVVNRALGGLSSRTYLTLGYWDALLAMLKPGDVVVMQFGHNDSGPLNDNYRARGSIKGIGEGSMEIDNIILKRHEVVHSYGWYLRKFITETKTRGATPIICSLVPRKIWQDGKIVTNSQDYAKWARDVATVAKVGFVDLNAIIAHKYEELGREKVDALFADAQTHTTRAGAELNAASVVAGLKSLKKNPLARYFSLKANEVEKAKPPKIK
jgi:lysophospholipase L1-like esterase